ncbi:MAG: DUF2269 family protein [Sphingobacteriales bacterium]|nr:DUF2269 family protein [Sphingobacteriales bacterium]
MNPYLFLKLIHIIAVIVFLGNIFTGLFWMRQADKTNNLSVISFTMKNIIKSDRWFTVPGVIVITAGGISSALYAGIPLLRTGWIFWPIVLFTLSGIVFSWKLVPLQKRIYQFTANADITNFKWAAYRTMLVKWEAWGLAALLAPVAALVMMILKILSANRL